MRKKPVIVLSFQRDGKNGGPYLSHKRIMESDLSKVFDLKAMYFPRIRELLRPCVFMSLVAELKAFHADIFQFAGLQIEGYLYYLVARRAGVRTICAIRGSTNEAKRVNPFHRIIARWCERKTLEKSDVCYTVSKYVESWETVKKYSKNLWGTIYNFYDYDAIHTNRRIEVREKLGISQNTIVIISTGRITIEKGYGTLFEIIARGDGWENVVFLIVGEGPYLSRMKIDIANKGLSNCTIFIGYQKSVSEYLDCADIFLSCTWHETFGNSIVEASFHGLPVVATAVGGVPEIVDTEKSGYLVKKDDVFGFIAELRKLINNPLKRKEMGDCGKRIVSERFNKEKIEHALFELYRSVLK